jgi:hypothetical protein
VAVGRDSMGGTARVGVEFQGSANVRER